MTGIVLVALSENDWAAWFAEQYLERGYVVLRAQTESECWLRVYRYFPDVVILSDHLTRGDALQFFNQLRSIEPSIASSTTVIGRRSNCELAARYGLRPHQCLQTEAQRHEIN